MTELPSTPPNRAIFWSVPVVQPSRCPAAEQGEDVVDATERTPHVELVAMNLDDVVAEPNEPHRRHRERRRVRVLWCPRLGQQAIESAYGNAQGDGATNATTVRRRCAL
jgi:hypothetical protein